ncbi:MAG: ArsR/SmtB family transcription factor [Candidatus Hodarchaeota archaeon]
MSELTDKIADFLKVLGDRTRLEILDLLKNGEKTSEEIQNALDKRQSTISQQLKKLFDEDLINFEKKENIKFYKIKDQFILKILTDIQSFVTTLQKKKAMRFADLDIYDTLSSRRI